MHTTYIFSSLVNIYSGVIILNWNIYFFFVKIKFLKKLIINILLYSEFIFILARSLSTECCRHYHHEPEKKIDNFKFHHQQTSCGVLAKGAMSCGLELNFFLYHLSLVFHSLHIHCCYVCVFKNSRGEFEKKMRKIAIKLRRQKIRNKREKREKKVVLLWKR